MIFLNNPEYIDLQIVGGWAYTQGGISGIIIYHSDINNYVAFERSAPHLTPEACSRMVVRNSIIMHCSCDDSEFQFFIRTNGYYYENKNSSNAFDIIRILRERKDHRFSNNEFSYVRQLVSTELKSGRAIGIAETMKFRISK